MSTVLLIGTGRLAFHLGHALRRSGVELAGVVGRDMGKTQELAKALECPAFGLADALPPADLRMLAVSDDAIATVAEGLPRDGKPVVHASGSKSLVLLSGHAHRGVRPSKLQPGSADRLFRRALVVDADDAGTLLSCRRRRPSSTVVHLPLQTATAPPERHHLTSVFLREAERLLLDHGIDPGLVHPLWKASSEKALLNADQAVTGPARRGDVKTIEQQLQLLSDEPDLRRAYAALSDLIFRTYHAQHRDQQDL